MFVINNSNVIMNDDNTFDFYFKPIKKTFTTLIDLENSYLLIPDEQLYCIREKWLNCAIRENKCIWNGNRNDTYKCQPK